MAKLHYLIGDATEPIQKTGIRYIIHVVNDIGAWGAGFVVPLGRKYPEARKVYLEFIRDQKPGENIEVWVEGYGPNDDLTTVVIHMIAQRGLISRDNPHPLDYQALEKCLNQVKEAVLCQVETEKAIHCPRFGSGLAGGDWKKIEKMIQEILVGNGINVYVYDLPK